MNDSPLLSLSLDSPLTVNEIVARYPSTIAVFNRLGIDVCCGGGVRLVEAARRDGLDPESVLAALHTVISEELEPAGAKAAGAKAAGPTVR